MKSAIIASVILVCCLLPQTYAQVVIQEILVNPAGTQAGGEAILLHNPSENPVDIAGWTIATGASQTDVRIPAGVVVCGKCSFLIADQGWASAKDNDTWPDADHEETMTLVNSNSGIALYTQTAVLVDKAGWGGAEFIPEELYRSPPTQNPPEGYSLRRVKSTGQNAADFIVVSPLWESPAIALVDLPIDLEVIAEHQLHTVVFDDESPLPGIQWNPKNASWMVRINGTGLAPELIVLSFAGANFSAKPADSSGEWRVAIDLKTNELPAAGKYLTAIEIHRNQSLQRDVVEVQVLEGLSLKASRPQSRLNATHIIMNVDVENSGNVVLQAGVLISSINQNNRSVELSWRCSRDGGAQKAASALKPAPLGTISPGLLAQFVCSAKLEKSLTPGKYNGTVTIVEIT